ncbi:MAG: hypothetical protein ABW128_20705, partial [Rhizorhabdus sp.]
DGCLEGDVCLGSVDTTNRLVIGGLTGNDFVPTHVRIGGGANNVVTSIRAQSDIVLGNAEGSTTFAGSDLLRIQSTAGSVSLLGDTVLSGGTAPGLFGGTVQVLGETGIDGAGATIRGENTVGLYTGSGDLTIGSLIAGTVNTLNASQEVVTGGAVDIAGAVTINNLFAVSQTDGIITAGGNLFVNEAQVADGRNIALTALNGDARLNAANPGPLGTAAAIDVVANAGNASIGSATATQRITVAGLLSASADSLTGGSIAVTSEGGDATLLDGTAATDIQVGGNGLTLVGNATAGGDIFIGGNSVSITGNVTATGAAASVFGSSVTIAATQGIRAAGTISAATDIFATSGAGLSSFAALTAGDDINVAAAELAVGSASTTGAFNDSTLGNDGSNITLIASGNLRADTANAFGDLAITANNGAVSGNAFAAGDDLVVNARTVAVNSLGTRGDVAESGYGAVADGSNISVTATGLDLGPPALDVGTALAANDLALTATVGSLQVGGFFAGRDAGLTAAGNAIVIAGGTAGRDIVLAANGFASAGALTAGDDVAVNGAAVLVDSITTNGLFDDSALENDGSNIAVGAVGRIDLTGKVDAFGNLAVASQTAGISGNVLTAGGDVSLSGSTIAVTSATSRGASGTGDILAIATGADAGTPALLLASASAARDLVLQANGGTASGGTVAAGRDISVLGQNASIGSGNAARDLFLTANGLASAGALTAGDDIVANGGTLAIGSALTTGTSSDSAREADGSNITLAADGAIDLTGTIDAFGDLAVTSANGAVTANILTAGDDATVSGTTVSIASITSRGALPESGYGTPDGSNIVITASAADLPVPAISILGASAAQDLIVQATGAGGSITGGTLAAGRNLTANAPGDIAIGGAAGRDILLTAGGQAGGGSFAAGDDIAISGNTIALVSAATTGAFNDAGLEADGSNIRLTATNGVGVTGTVDATNNLTVTSANGAITAVRANPGDAPATFAAGGAVNVTASNGPLTLDRVQAGGDANLRASADLALGEGTAAGDLLLTGGNINLGTASPNGSLVLTATNDIAVTGALASAGRRIILDAGGAIVANALRSINSLTLDSGAGTTTGDLESFGGIVRATAGGDMAVGNVRSAGSIFLTGGGAITAGDIAAGTGPLLSDQSDTDAAPGGLADGFEDVSLGR